MRASFGFRERKLALLIFTAFTASFGYLLANEDSVWHFEPFQIQADGAVIDTFTFDKGGHAAPFFADIDGDNQRDLVVGSIVGRFRIFQNVGTNSDPIFGSASKWLIAGSDNPSPAQVPNFCCVASGPQLVDVDGDGLLDLSAGSYYPGLVYWFKGLPHARFGARQILCDTNALPIFADPNSSPYCGESKSTYMSNIAWVDWNGDSHLDLLIGNLVGDLYVRLNAAGLYQDTIGQRSSAVAGQPVFLGRDASDTALLLGNGERPINEMHSAPCVADWDGDGLWDIIVGCDSGAVYYLKNTGEVGRPMFFSRQQLLCPGVPRQWLADGESAKRGIRSQVNVVDYNNDGRLDLLVGDWSVIEEWRNGLTAEELKRATALRDQLDALDKQLGFCDPDPAYRAIFYATVAEKSVDTKNLGDVAAKLQSELNKYTKRFSEGRGNSERSMHRRYSGTIWVYIRK